MPRFLSLADVPVDCSWAESQVIESKEGDAACLQQPKHRKTRRSGSEADNDQRRPDFLSRVNGRFQRTESWLNLDEFGSDFRLCALKEPRQSTPLGGRPPLISEFRQIGDYLHQQTPRREYCPSIVFQQAHLKCRRRWSWSIDYRYKEIVASADLLGNSGAKASLKDERQRRFPFGPLISWRVLLPVLPGGHLQPRHLAWIVPTNIGRADRGNPGVSDPLRDARLQRVRGALRERERDDLPRLDPSSMRAAPRREIASVFPAPAQAITWRWPPRWAITFACSGDG